MFFLFRRKERTKEKSIMSFSRKCILVRAFLGEYIGRCVCFLSLRYRSKSQRRFLLPKYVAHASYNLTSFRDSANDLFLFRQVAPAPCSPPLGGSDGNSAVRFTPAGKYGGRENKLSRRATRCMSGHPCRAHHKLKWARKFGRYIRTSV